MTLLIETVTEIKRITKIDLQVYDFSIDNNKELLFNGCVAAISNSHCALW